jgi:hypothetical protein
VKLILFLTLLNVARAQEGPPPLEDAEQKKLIADVTAHALGYSKDLPDFVCTEVIRKNEDPTATSRRWKLLDTIHEQVTFRGKQEEFREVLNNGKKADSDGKPNWMVSPNDFSDMISWIFDPKYHATFQWSKWDSLRGHRVHEIAYVVKPDDSQLTVGKKQTRVGMIGLIDVDADTGVVLKISMVATGLTKNSPVAAVSREFNYDFAKIGDHYYLLPLKADMQAREGHTLIWNEFEFRDYRKP